MTTQAKLMTPKTIVRLVIVLLVVPLAPMIISGVWDWREEWVYAIINILGFIISRVLAARRNPYIITERAPSMELQDAKSWDKILSPMLAFGALIVLIVAGADKRFGWSTPFSLAAKIMALIVIILGYLLGSWALIENRFFSGVVRIQTDRGHHVVTTGPYRIVHHPGYAGALWIYVAMPILFDSLWAFIPTVLLIGVLVLRTSQEDRTLQAELPGYKEFAQKTRYRLLPGMW
jgi:protein-S-isoprenylcysteine O-methyltransferase Ste14